VIVFEGLTRSGSVSFTGEYVTGPRIITAETNADMKRPAVRRCPVRYRTSPLSFFPEGVPNVTDEPPPMA
jgi:hypothetical protein